MNFVEKCLRFYSLISINFKWMNNEKNRTKLFTIERRKKNRKKMLDDDKKKEKRQNKEALLAMKETSKVSVFHPLSLFFFLSLRLKRKCFYLFSLSTLSLEMLKFIVCSAFNSEKVNKTMETPSAMENNERQGKKNWNERKLYIFNVRYSWIGWRTG